MKRLLLILLPLVVACGCDKNDETYYAVGDIYSHDGKVGIVVSVSQNGLHGKIVSTDETEECLWSVEEVVTGANDEDDGMNNMKIIRSVDGWREKYPAFAWCADKGEDWYLPAINELRTIRDAKIVALSEKYWSSTEYEKQPDAGVNTINMLYGTEYATRKNQQYIRVRAMAAF